MARISTYGQDSTLSKLDKVIGTDSATGQTKNYTIESIVSVVNEGGLVESFDGSTFTYKSYVEPSETPAGVINLNASSASQAAFSAINQIYISVLDKTGLSVAEYLENADNDFIKISKKDNINQFGIYEVTAIENYGDGAYKKLSLTPRGTNGNLNPNDSYFVSNYSALYDQDFSDDSVTEFGDISDNFFTGTGITELANAGSGQIITGAERASLTNFTNNGLIHADVVNNVTSTAVDVPLSAAQGKVLKDLIDSINSLLEVDTEDAPALDTLREIVNFCQTNASTLSSLGIGSITGLQAALDLKQNTEAGKGLSANDFTLALKNKLDGIAANAQVNVKADWSAVAGTDAEILNKPTDLTNLSIHDVTELRDVTSAGSGAIITGPERTKLTNIDVNATTRTVTDGTDSIIVPPANAEQNVQADWNETDNLSDAFIQNKPSLAPSNAEQNVQVNWNESDNTSDAFILNKPALAPSNAEQNVQVDWDETDTNSDAFILNKPDVISSIYDLTDVYDSSSYAGVTGQTLVYSSSLGQFVRNELYLEKLGNVLQNQSNSVGKFLGVTSFNGSNGVNTYDAVSIDTSDLSDINITSAQSNELLQYNASTSNWENVTNVALPGTLEFTATESSTPTFDNGIYYSTEDGHDTLHFRYHGHDLSIDYLTENIPTGILNGGELSTNTNTTFDIAAGDGIINILNKGAGTDPHPEIKKIAWSATTVTHTLGDANDADQINTWIYVDQNGAIQQTTSDLTPGIWRSNIVLGAVIHSSNIIRFVRTFPRTAYSSGNTYAEFVEIFGPLKKSGHLLTVNSTNTLALDRAAGQAFALGRNYITDPLNPSLVSDGASTPVFHRYSSTSTGFTKDNGVGGVGFASIDPSKYDNNGTIDTVSGGHYSVQRLYHFPNNTGIIVAYYGKEEYASIDEAEKNYLLENFQEANNTATQAIYLGALIVKGNATDLSDSSQAKILTGGIFRSLSAANLGGVAANSALSDLSDVTITSPTNGQVVKYNSTTGQFENQAEGGSIDGTGAANKLAIWSDTDTLTNDTNLHWDTTNDRLGIGAISPSEKLHVDGNIKTSSNFIADNATLGSLSLRISGTETGRLDNFNSALRLINFHASSETLIQGNGDVSLNSVGSNNIKIHTANTERMRIDSSGNVGIGTDTPSSLLSVRTAGISGSQDFATFSRGSSTEYEVLKISRSAGNTEFLANQNITLSADYDSNHTGANSNIILKTDNVERMRINSAGNVGIGTTTPLQKLNVSGNISLDKYTGSDFNRIIGINDAAGAYGAGSSYIEFEELSGTGTSNTTKGGNIRFHNHLFGGGTNETLSIIANGNVGIGTASPSTKLHVQETSNIGIASYYATAIIESGDAQLDITSGPGGTWGSSLNFIEGNGAANTDIWSIVRKTSSNDSDLFFNFGTNNQHTNDTKVAFNSNGKVGIGTDQPEVSLDLGNNTDALQLPAGDNTARAAISNPFGGMIRYNTTDNQFEGYSGVGAAGSWGAIGGSGGGGGSGEIVKSTFSATGSASFSLPDTIVDIDNVNVYVSGVYQYPSNYTVSGNTVTFNPSSIPTAGTDNVHIRHNVTATTLTEGAAFSTSGSLVGDGTTVTFALGGSPRSSDHTMVFLEGVYQEKENYSISGSNITFTTAPPNGYSIEVKYVSGVLDLTDVGEIILDELTGDGTATYALSSVPLSENYTNVYIEGVYQEKGTYSVSGANITFSSNVPTGYSIEVSTMRTIASSSVTQTSFVSDEFTANGSTTDFALVNGSPGSKSLTMVFIQGVYQNKSKYDLASNEIRFTAGTPDEDDMIEVISMSAINTVESPVTSVNGEVGAVTVASKHNVSVISSDTTAAANTLYVLTANLDLTLPVSPAMGDSIKISNRSGVTTCQLLRNGNNILGAAADLTLDTATASFELVYTDTANGWIIIGQ